MSKLKNIRVIAPSESSNVKTRAKKKRALQTLNSMGYSVSFGKNISNKHRFNTASVEDRIADLESAFKDKNVDAIICFTGGYSANSLLLKINWDILKNNPKPLIGYSDITVLVNAIYAMTGKTIGLLGPSLGVLAERLESEYTYKYLQAALNKEVPLKLVKSQKWGPRNRQQFKTGWKILQTGIGEGIAIGGNLGSFYLLQGTEFMPRFRQNTILLVEEDDEPGKNTAQEFERRLMSILDQPNARKYIKGIMIGRFLPGSKVSFEDIKDIVSRMDLKDLPVVANLDFGHSIPMFTVPIGSTISLNVKNRISCEILKT